MLPQRITPPGGGARKRLGGSTFDANYSTGSADLLLPRLDRVRQTGADQWIACCPAHEDRSPSLSIKQADDRLLLHCFAGCDAGDVLAAVGLSLSDLFDRPLTHHKPRLSERQRRRYGQAQDALQALAHEALIVAIAADRLSAGNALDQQDITRLHQARDLIQRAYATAGRALPELPSACPELKRPSDFTEEIIGYMEQVSRGEVQA